MSQLEHPSYGRNQILDPEKPLKLHVYRYDAALVVGPVLAYLFGAGTERGDGHRDGHREIPHHIVFVHVANESARVLDVTRRPGDRGILLDEVREAHFQVGCLRMEFLFRFPQDVGKVLHVDHALFAVQDLHESAHVRALVIVRKVHVHIDRGYGVLVAVRFVKHRDRVCDVFHAHLVISRYSGGHDCSAHLSFATQLLNAA